MDGECDPTRMIYVVYGGGGVCTSLCMCMCMCVCMYVVRDVLRCILVLWGGGCM